MQSRLPLTLALLTAAACVPGSPVYFGPPLSTLQGQVYSAEARTPLAQAEVCIFGADTSCLRAGEGGDYKFQVFAQTVSVRFRGPGHSPALVDSVRLVTDSTVIVNCALSSRVLLSNRPIACLPIPGQYR